MAEINFIEGEFYLFGWSILKFEGSASFGGVDYFRFKTSEHAGQNFRKDKPERFKRMTHMPSTKLKSGTHHVLLLPTSSTGDDYEHTR